MGQHAVAQQRAVYRPCSESALRALAGELARAWRAGSAGALLVGLSGDLGAGKTTWVRGMLEGLGYPGRVPSPTYTLLEHYALPGLDLVHVDLYRLGGAAGDADARGEFETLGLRDWLARPRCWVLVEWPERSGELVAHCDLRIELHLDEAPEARRVECLGQSAAGARLLTGLQGVSEFGSS